MDNSTDQVTLAAAFVSDILTIYKEKSASDYAVLAKMTDGLNLSNPMGMVPIETYNKMCDWIEQQVGQANAKLVGRQIGRTAFEAMKSFKMVDEKSTPLDAMKALATVATTLIKDPKKRGWEIEESGAKHIIMKKTQTFNSTIQFGLLDEIIRKTGVLSPKVEYLKSVKNGDEFDIYKITWL